MTRHHDLPPRWDGLPVKWDTAWEALNRRLHVCHIEPGGSRSLLDDLAGADVCAGCGMSTHLAVKSGTITYQTGHQTRYRRLTAYRCTRCGHDDIVELTPSGPQYWTLDPDDYTDTGSYERVV